ncbi:hypothetical protein GKC56_04965 [Neisseriaceae bacterium PsAf]|nr:hypothetical protein [Neisseriaceae bacterium PsAf]
MKFYDYEAANNNIAELGDILRKEQYLLLINNRDKAEKLLKALEDYLELDEFIYLDNKEINGKMYYFITYLDFDRKKVIKLLESQA